MSTPPPPPPGRKPAAPFGPCGTLVGTPSQTRREDGVDASSTATIVSPTAIHASDELELLCCLSDASIGSPSSSHVLSALADLRMSPGVPSMECDAVDDDRWDQSATCEAAKLPRVVSTVHVGSFSDVTDAAAVRRAGIRAFVCVADNVGAAPFPEGVDAARTLHIAVPDKAATQLADHLPELFAFVDAATAVGEHVVVYCRQGISRSVAFVVALVMRALGLPHDAALEHVRRVYPKAEPNFAFVCQLREFDTPILANAL